MSLKKSLLAVTALACLGYAAPALAQTCATNADCSPGFTCQVSGVVTSPACPPDADCLKGGAGGDSGTVTVSTCQPGPCATDSDCGAGMLCDSHDVTSCSGGTTTAPCAANTKCDASQSQSEPTCTTQTVSMCAYRWQLPCNADVDCGDGFICQPSVSGACSGGSPVSGGAAGGATGSPAILPGPPDDCTTTTSYPGSCQVAVPSCLVDTDCPAGWRCVSYVDPGATGVGEAPASGAGGSAVSKSAALISSPTPGMCSSPFSAPVAVKNDGATGAGGASGAGAGGSSAPSASGSGGTLGTTAGGATDGRSTAEGSAKTVTNDGGCSIGAHVTGSPSSLAVVALLGLGLIARRRRR
ncbi:MAG TPA: MYXO-CTERM sorting domain-containing protein [Polyangia bacterium]